MSALAVRIALCALLAWPAAAPAASDDVIAVRAGRLHTQGAEGTLAGGVVLIQGGVIARVGKASEVTIPADARVVEAAVVTPGLIDAHGVLGLSGAYNVRADQDQDESTGPSQPGLRAIDGFNPRDELLDWVLEHGVTTVQSGPGEANPIGGLAGVFKTWGDDVDAMTVRFPSAMVFSLGETPKQTYKGKAPATRMGTAAIIRKALLEAQEYAAKRAPDGGFRLPLVGGSKQEKKPAKRDLGKEALGLVLAGEIPALFTARREDDLQTALRIGREFGLRVQLADATEAYLMRDAIRAAGVPVLVGPVMGRPSRPESINHSFESAALLSSARIPIAFQSGYESYVPKARVVLFEAAVAVSFGLADDVALRALTIEAARLLGVDERVGSLEPGKDADLALFDGDPFEYTSHVTGVLVNGQIVYER